MLKISNGSGTNLGEKGSYEAFKHLKELGYDAVDYQPFCTEPGTGIYAFDDKKFEEFLKMDAAFAREIGLDIIQTHGLWPYDDTRPEQYDLKFEAMVKSIKGSAIVGAKYVVMHPVMPTMWEPSPHRAEDLIENTEYFRKLVPYAREYGIKIALENMPGYNVPCTTTQELIDCIDAIDSEYLVACFDTGHNNCSCERFVSKENIGDSIRMLGDRLACIHIHDNDGQNDQHMLPFSGNIKWNAFTAALRDIKYRGSINFECHAPDAPNGLALPVEKWLVDVGKYFANEIIK